MKLTLYLKEESCFIENKSISPINFASVMNNIQHDFDSYISAAFQQLLAQNFLMFIGFECC